MVFTKLFSNSRLSPPTSPSYVSHSRMTRREKPNECSQFSTSLKCPSLGQIWPCPVVLNLTQSPDEGKGIMYFILRNLQNIHWCHKVRSSVKMIWHHRPVWSCLGLHKFFIQPIRQIFCDTFIRAAAAQTDLTNLNMIVTQRKDSPHLSRRYNTDLGGKKGTQEFS